MLVLLLGCGPRAGGVPASAPARDPARLIAAKCSACHPTPAPGSQPPEAWPGILEEHEGFLYLSQEDRALLLELLAR